jgi:hypothetical protein
MMGGRAREFVRPLFYLGHNAVTLAGAVITSASAITLVTFYFTELFGFVAHPYAGILFFLVLPAVFVIGLLLIPYGALRRRRQLVKAGLLPVVYPPVNLQDPNLRRGMGWVGLATGLNIVIFFTASYRGVHYMDSVQFCGLTCHAVMQPEYTAYQASSHSRVACVGCHIGPGASWFVRSKLSGTYQVISVTFRLYSRPIPSPVENLRPARETCEQCHWPEKFEGDKFVVFKKFADDEKNTATYNVLVMKIGGQSPRGGVGIHGVHVGPGREIDYLATDRQRQTIPWIRSRDAKGNVTEYVAADWKPTAETGEAGLRPVAAAGSGPQARARGERRVMDCMDCHNRPTHAFQLPERAMDEAMAEGQISPELPFIKKRGVALLRANYSSHDEARRTIARELREFYRANYAEVLRAHGSEIEAAIEELSSIYRRNVFPQMNVTWGTYPNNLGHMDFTGCFRCHDGNHVSSDGKMVVQDCSACHTLLAVEEAAPKVLQDLGLQ